MTMERRPAAFRIDQPKPQTMRAERPVKTRSPRALDVQAAVVSAAPVDVFGETDMALDNPPPALPPRRRSWLATIFFSAMGALIAMGVGVLADGLIRSLFSRADWLGWIGLGVAAVSGAAFLLIILRELASLIGLASIEKIRKQGREALLNNDARAARTLVGALTKLMETKPETAAGRRMLAGLDGEIVDGVDLVRLAETEMLSPLDARAQKLVLDAAKRVSVVTAVSPRALVDVGYVFFEAGRLIRRIAELYGGRPGWLGMVRLTRSVLAHLAVTSSIAVGDGIIQQVIGHGLAARLSARLGEGVVNGMMTARIGIAAMEAARPLPFTAVKRPGMGDFLSALTKFTAKDGEASTTSDK